MEVFWIQAPHHWPPAAPAPRSEVNGDLIGPPEQGWAPAAEHFGRRLAKLCEADRKRRARQAEGQSLALTHVRQGLSTSLHLVELCLPGLPGCRWGEDPVEVVESLPQL